MSVKCLIFDLDDTLVNSTLAYEKALSTINLSSKDLLFQNARSAVKSRLPEGHVSARNRLLYFKEILVLQERFSPKALFEMMSRYEKSLFEEIRSQWKSLGRQNLLTGLSQKYRLGIITNENARSQYLKLTALDQDGDFFKTIITSEEAGIEKPIANIFLDFFSKSGFLPEECCMIGDSMECDIVPAKNLGVKSILTVEFSSVQGNPIGPYIENLNELLSIKI